MSIDPKKIAFAIITYYPKWYNGKLKSISHTDKIRGDLALQFIQNALSKNYQVVLVDGKSSKNFRKKISNFKNLKNIKRRSFEYSPAKRQAFKAASKLPGVKIIITSEPEKVPLVNNIPDIIKPILKGKADIVVAKREAILFKKSFPDYMYKSEIEANKEYNKQLRLNNLLSKKDADLDMFFGPRIFTNTPEILSLFTGNFLKDMNNTDPEKQSNTLYFPIVMALKLGLKVESVEIPFSYPKIQKNNEEKGARVFFMKKRDSQKLSILGELMHLLNYLNRKAFYV